MKDNEKKGKVNPRREDLWIMATWIRPVTSTQVLVGRETPDILSGFSLVKHWKDKRPEKIASVIHGGHSIGVERWDTEKLKVALKQQTESIHPNPPFLLDRIFKEGKLSFQPG